MVCKISGNNKRDLKFLWRLISFVMYGPWEDHLNRHETAFYQQVAPHLKDTSFRCPKVYFVGMYLIAVVYSRLRENFTRNISQAKSYRHDLF